jgi:hypothetical protein
VNRISYFVQEELGSRLTSLGFTMVTRPPQAAAAYYRGQPPGVTPLSAWELMAPVSEPRSDLRCEREAQHAHPQYVLYALTDYRVRNTNADGTTRVFEHKAGEVFWGEAVIHGGENIGTTEVRAVIVELKAAATR